MLKRNRYRKIPPNPNRRKKRERQSKPLARSVHIEEERWGWEVHQKRTCGQRLRDCSCFAVGGTCASCKQVDKKVKIISPDNKYFEVNAEEFEITREWECGQKYIDTEIRPGAVKEYIVDKLLERSVA